MGHQFSKDEHHHYSHQYGQRHPLARNAGKAGAASKKSFAGSVGQDDVRSRATETTHQSTPPASPKMTMSYCYPTNNKNGSANSTTVRHHPHRGWRRTIGGGGGSSPASAAASTNPSRRISSYQQHSQPGPSSSLHQHLQQQTTQWQPSPHQSSAPIKCPPKTRRGVARGYSAGGGGGGGTMSHDGGEVDDDDDSDLENYEELTYLERMYDLKSWDMFYRITQARKQAEERRKARESSTSSSSSSSTSSFLQRNDKEEEAQADHPPPAPQDATGTEETAATMAVPVPGRFLPFGSLPSEVDDEWENLGLDYEGDENETNHGDASESHLIFTFDF